ncbi:hypothetical protein EZS27_003589 [termite gut metagenome]|uniref:Uncharacterized protein n=1 Tax=termite gut metagenome TaxID=433724 RepID=A0A5J4SS27_9ZZZZ
MSENLEITPEQLNLLEHAISPRFDMEETLKDKPDGKA